MIRISVQRDPIAIDEALTEIEADSAGAVASFTGLVRADDGVSVLDLEHYPGMTEKALENLAEDAAARWGLIHATIVHRVGPMIPGERVVFVATSALHRSAALDACASLIDRLKTEAPFWKREITQDGHRWVEARDADAEIALRWRSATTSDLTVVEVESHKGVSRNP